MGIDLADLVGFSPADTASLRELKPLMAGSQEEVINAFYGRILSFPGFKEMIERICARDKIDVGQLVAHINSIQFKHWQHFFDGTPDEAFTSLARKIGTAHERCLLTNDLYVASSAIILENFLGLAVGHHLADTEQAAKLKKAIGGIIHMFFLDLAHAISGYDKAAAQTAFRQASEPLLNAFEHEVTRDLGSMASAAKELDGTTQSIVELNRDNLQRCRDTIASIKSLIASLGELGQVTQQIEGFAAVINDVARKTKLLALNAAIEAARSGEYGRGFSVVANEVKALANEAEGATKQVTRQASEIQAAIEHAIKQVGGSQKLVQAIDEGVVNESRAIEHQSAAVTEISTNLAAVSESARGLRSRFDSVKVA
ncbi:globin-coupled sensor protein [Bradyrhizobium sp.]|uniref:globin-coupled sensor protein n=1 Tax=Bradyrhizobium sp. TaxID=376 RepID=UPI00262F4B8A|nr:globin-coupled sensor protein [Bradyrhizobium sp.]